MTNTATFIKKLDRGDDAIDARLYRLSKPMATRSWTDDALQHTRRSTYVVVSGSTRFGLSRPETYIFLADESGEVLSWTECDGSFQGAIDHAQALKNAGYEIEGDDA